MSDARILICIPYHNRGQIVRECIPTVRTGMAEGDRLAIYDDGSTEWGMPYEINLKADYFHQNVNSIGIEAQRRNHFMSFWRQREEFTHLYLTDSDALHDPIWRWEALRLQEKYNGNPLCLYNTDAHVRLVGNTIQDDPEQEVIWRRVAPGISYLLTLEHVSKVVRALPHLPEHWHWDWTVPALLGNQFAVSRVSFVDHIGHSGMHHPEGEGYDGGDVALNPTAWLMSKRADVISRLKANVA